MKKKIILNLSSIDYSGAGTFTKNFNDMLISAGYESYLVVKDKKTQYPFAIQYPNFKLDNILKKIISKFAKWKRRKIEYEYDYYYYNVFEKYSKISTKTILSLIPNKPDVIFIHWVTDFINAKIVSELQLLTEAKIYWLMVDNAPLTGGCHYPWNCKGYENDCSSCPAIITDKYKTIALENLRFKKKYLPNSLRLLVFSENDFQRANKSAIFKTKAIIKMPGYFIDEDKFCPGNKDDAKAYFELKKGQIILFFGATSLIERRKGMTFLLEALKSLDSLDLDFILLVAGSITNEFTYSRMKMLGNLNEDELIKAYQASDVFVCPTLEDSGPTMINQAMMCGLPVVSFPIGIGADLVKTYETGYLATQINPDNLANGIRYMLKLNNAELLAMGSNCRKLAIDMYGGKANYQKVLSELVEN